MKADRRWWNDGRMEREIEERKRFHRGRLDVTFAYPKELLSNKRVTAEHVPMGLRIAMESMRLDIERRREIAKSDHEIVYDDGECIVTRACKSLETM